MDHFASGKQEALRCPFTLLLSKNKWCAALSFILRRFLNIPLTDLSFIAEKCMQGPFSTDVSFRIPFPLTICNRTIYSLSSELWATLCVSSDEFSYMQQQQKSWPGLSILRNLRCADPGSFNDSTARGTWTLSSCCSTALSKQMLSSCEFPHGCNMAAPSPSLTSALQTDRWKNGWMVKGKKPSGNLIQTFLLIFWPELGHTVTSKPWVRELWTTVRPANQYHLTHYCTKGGRACLHSHRILFLNWILLLVSPTIS